MKSLPAAALAVLALTGSAMAWDGNELWSVCETFATSTDDTQIALDTGACYGYIVGVYDAKFLDYAQAVSEYLLGNTDADTFDCVVVPEDATYEQLTGIVREYLRHNPGERHRKLGTVVTLALQDSWGCGK